MQRANNLPSRALKDSQNQPSLTTLPAAAKTTLSSVAQAALISIPVKRWSGGNSLNAWSWLDLLDCRPKLGSKNNMPLGNDSQTRPWHLTAELHVAQHGLELWRRNAVVEPSHQVVVPEEAQRPHTHCLQHCLTKLLLPKDIQCDPKPKTSCSLRMPSSNTFCMPSTRAQHTEMSARVIVCPGTLGFMEHWSDICKVGRYACVDLHVMSQPVRLLHRERPPCRCCSADACPGWSLESCSCKREFEVSWVCSERTALRVSHRHTAKANRANHTPCRPSIFWHLRSTTSESKGVCGMRKSCHVGVQNSPKRVLCLSGMFSSMYVHNTFTPWRAACHPGHIARRASSLANCVASGTWQASHGSFGEKRSRICIICIL